MVGEIAAAAPPPPGSAATRHPCMAFSMVGMGFAAAGALTPVGGALLQEVIDVLAVLNALRAAFPPAHIHDF